MSISIKPLEDRIVVQTAEAEQTTASGLVIPDTGASGGGGRGCGRGRQPSSAPVLPGPGDSLLDARLLAPRAPPRPAPQGEPAATLWHSR